MSSFDHSFDKTLRVGDCVITKPGRHVSVESERHDPLNSLKKAGVVPRSLLRQLARSNATAAGSTSVPSPTRSGIRGPGAGGHSPTALGTSGGASGTLDAPSSTLKFLQLIQRNGGALLDDSDAPGPVLGVIKSLNRRGNFVVDVWRRGDIVPPVTQRREQAVFTGGQLVKLAPQEFHAACRKPYMSDANYQLMLISNGYDASAPVSLMAYNNRLIQGIMERIDTRVHMEPDPALRLRVMRERKVAPGTVIRAEAPKAVPVLDPLADVREELRALAGFGDAPRGKHSGQGAGSRGPSRAGGQRPGGADATVLMSDSPSAGTPAGPRSDLEPERGRASSRLAASRCDVSAFGVLFGGGASGSPSVSPTPGLNSVSFDEVVASVMQQPGMPRPARLATLTEEMAVESRSAAAERCSRGTEEALEVMAGAAAAATHYFLPMRYYDSAAANDGKSSRSQTSGTSGSGAALPRVQRVNMASSGRATGAAASTRGGAGASVTSSQQASPDPLADYPIRGHIERCFGDAEGSFVVRVRNPAELAGKTFVATLSRVALFRATPAQADTLRAMRAVTRGSPRMASTSILFGPGSPNTLLTEESVYLEDPIDAVEALSRLKSQLLYFKPIAQSANMAAVCDIKLSTGDSLAEELVGSGLARPVLSAFDDAAVLYTTEVTLRLGSVTAARSEVTKIRQAQTRAMQQKLGMWQLPGVETNFITSAGDQQQQQTVTSVPSAPSASGTTSTTSTFAAMRALPAARGPAGGLHENLFAANSMSATQGPPPPEPSTQPLERVDDDATDVGALFTDFESSAAFLKKVQTAVENHRMR